MSNRSRNGNRQNIIYLKSNSLYRRILIRFLSNYFPLYIVTEHPKSGGTWVSQMIAEYFGVTFPRNKMPVWGSQVMHCHQINLERQKNLFVVYRDGRDVAVSYYYHSFFYNDLYNARHVDLVRANITFDDYTDIHSNLPRFIEFLYDDRYHPHLTWRQFVDHWNRRNAAVIRYENLLENCPEELGKAIEKVTEMPADSRRLEKIRDNFSFAKQTQHKNPKGSQVTWLRKGIAGDWKNVFTREAAEVFVRHAGDALIASGYEKDHSWIKTII